MKRKSTNFDKNIPDSTIRLDKFLASRGISARRNIAEILKKHTITINNKLVKEPGERFDLEKDVILFDGKQLKALSYVYIKLYKPKNVVSTVSDEFGRKTVVSLVVSKERLYPVGRLDQDTTGLLLLTNDGELANRLTHPRYHIPKRYKLTIYGNVSVSKVAHFKRGVMLEDGMTAKASAEVVKETEKQTVLEVILHEGKKRQIRRMCEALHLPLVELKRISMGPIQLGDMKEGEYKNLSEEELVQLKNEAYRKM